MAQPAAPQHSVAEGSGHRRADIQGLRAIAVLSVVAFHTHLPVRGGFVGVDVFFVISGFVITTMLARERRDTGGVRLGAFYVRRFRRLTPALALMVVSTLIGATLLLSPVVGFVTTVKTGLGTIAFAANIVIARSMGGYFDTASAWNPLLHTWSLSVEEQFYLVFPVLVVVCVALRRRRPGRSLVPFALGTLALVSFAAMLAGPSVELRHFDHLLGFYSPITRAWEFAVGALLAERLFARPLAIGSRVRGGTAAVGAGCLLASFRFISGSTTWPGPWTLLPVVGTALLLLAGTEGTNRVNRALAARPLVRIGDWSYSIYLWHWPFVVVADLHWRAHWTVAVPAALLSLVPALASHRWVERPVRAEGYRHLRLVTVLCVVPLVVVSSVIVVMQRRSWGSPRVDRMMAAYRMAWEGTLRGCNEQVALGSPAIASCAWNTDAPGEPVYLVGDSNANHFTDGLVEAARRTGRPMYFAGADGCPFARLYQSRRHLGRSRSCRPYVVESVRYLRTAEPGLVIISQTDGYLDNADVGLGLTEDTLSFDPATKARTIRIGLERTVRSVRASGHRVVLVQSVPRWIGDASWDPVRCSLITVLRDGCTRTGSLADARRRQAPGRALIAGVARDTGTRVWDPGPWVCPDGMCSVDSPEFGRYLDRSHISIAQSRALAGPFTALLRSDTAPPVPAS